MPDPLAGKLPMNLYRTALAAALALASVSPALAADAPLSLADPAAFVERLKGMGYAPTDFDNKEGAPSVVITQNDSRYSMAFGGCSSEKKDCRYIALIGKFSDVANPPADWIAKENIDFDYIKVWVGEDKLLTYSTGIFVEGMSEATFKNSVQLFIESGGNLAQDAIAAKLDK